MTAFSRFGTTTMAAAVVVILLSRCASSGPSEAESHDTGGVLLFDLNDLSLIHI